MENEHPYHIIHEVMTHLEEYKRTVHNAVPEPLEDEQPATGLKEVGVSGGHQFTMVIDEATRKLVGLKQDYEILYDKNLKPFKVEVRITVPDGI